MHVLDKYFRFLKYFGLAFVIQLVFLAIWIVGMNFFDVRDPGIISEILLWLYLWPLLVLPVSGSHGGEIFFTPFTAIFYSAIFGIIFAIIKRTTNQA
jgi:hypothetical protein